MSGALSTQASEPGNSSSTLPSVIIFTQAGCPYCRKAKSALQAANVTYQEAQLADNDDSLDILQRFTDCFTFPQILANGKFVGGWEDLSRKMDDGQLSRQLADSGTPLPKDIAGLVAKGTSVTSESEVNEWFKPEDMSLDAFQSRQAEGNLLRTALAVKQAGGSLFSSRDAEEVLMAKSGIRSLEHVHNLLEDLLKMHVIHRVDQSSVQDNNLEKTLPGSRVFQYITDILPPSRGDTLNTGACWFGKSRSAIQVSEGLRRILLQLYDEHMSADGKAINYKAMAEDRLFQRFVVATTELQGLDVSTLSREERIAFFLNIYNVLVVHAIAVVGPPSNFFQRLTQFAAIKYCIGGQIYSADDIEHGILRGNRPTAASIPVLLGHPEWSKGYFKKDDLRLKLAVQPMDKRIHFALNCGAKSCPPIKVFSADSLESGLRTAAGSFCQGDLQVDKEKQKIKLSPIFKWYSMDFGSKDEVINFLLEHVNGELKKDLLHLSSSENGINIEYAAYDWGVNSTEEAER